MHEAFFFGQGEHQLFGSYHPPAGGLGRTLTVICPPLFTEMVRTHGALRKVAISLSNAGQHVLRFDYRGTGDSFGDLTDVTVSDWLEDVSTAIREGRDISGSRTIRVLGVRAGALLACKSVGAADEIERIVLWDPVGEGAAYLDAMAQAQASMVEKNPYLAKEERSAALEEVGTYRLSPRMLHAFGALDREAYACVPRDRLRVVNSTSEVGLPIPGVQLETIGHPCDWGVIAEDRISPDPILERLVTHLTE